ncbi:MAG: ethylbenzene dehydrogenase-related protein [Proteobacteria bacterium]|nr:ethylbenzene dehydrogenase-related protein [Pseudomonadota bacterium]
MMNSFVSFSRFILLVTSLSFVLSACTSGPISVTPEVAGIISTKCAGCHSVKFVTLPELAYVNYIGGCGGCHVPFPEGHDSANCTACHNSPEKTHFNLRDKDDQTRLTADAENACVHCHLGDFNKMGKGFPPLTNDDEIMRYARQGTLRQWIQPGGSMAKYLTESEAATLTNWIDRISKNRKLDYDPYFDAVKIDSDFAINGKGDNVLWDSAPEHVIALGLTPMTALSEVPPIPQTDQVKLKALYSDNYLYIRAEYKDPTLSMTRSGSWIYDDAKKSWGHPPAIKVYEKTYPTVEVYAKQAEDGLAFIWNISIPDYKTTYGCAIKCHGNVPGACCFTDKKGSTADIWYAKAARGMALLSATQTGIPTVSTENSSYAATEGEITLSGYADDKYLIWYMDLDDGYNTVDDGRIGDAGDSAYSSNLSADKRGPQYMELHPDNYSDAMVLTLQEIDEGQAIIADPDDPQYAGIEAVETAWAYYAALQSVVPEMILTPPAGSRSDVLTAATWTNGVWITEFKRKLRTGNQDDIQFSPLKDYEFSIAAFDNCGWGEIPPMHNTYGNGQYQILRFK